MIDRLRRFFIIDKRPRIQFILLAVNFVVLLLPLGGISVLRLYESALIRQTESELIAQGAFVSAAYKSALLQHLDRENVSPDVLDNLGKLPDPRWLPVNDPDEPWQPNPPRLDLANDDIYAKPEPALTPTVTPSPYSMQAGESITPMMREAQVVTLAAIRVVDPNGIVIATTRSELGQAISHRQEVARALQGEQVSIMRQRISDEPPPPILSISRGANLRVFVSFPIFVDKHIVGAVLLSRTPRDILQALYGKRYILVGATVSLFVVVILLTLFTSYAINTPIKKLIVQAGRAVKGEKGAVKPLQKPVTSEVEQLSNAIAQMATTLEYRAEYFQNFAAHVSHAFKTPLTAIQGAVEILQDHIDNMPPEKRQKFLLNINDDCQRLDNMVVKLMELAKADSIQISHHRTDPLLKFDQVCQRYQEAGLHIHVNSDHACPVNMEEALFDSVIATILENASQQTATQMNIYFARPDDRLLNIYFQDNGPGVSEANMPKIFQPFFTTRPNTGGTGLGLAVAKRIAIAHGGDLSFVHDSSNKGALFCLSLLIAA